MTTGRSREGETYVLIREVDHGVVEAFLVLRSQPLPHSGWTHFLLVLDSSTPLAPPAATMELYETTISDTFTRHYKLVGSLLVG